MVRLLVRKAAVNVDFLIHVERLNGNYQTVTAIVLPDGTILKRDGNTIDFEPMKEYVGSLFIFVWNGIPDPSVKVLKSVGTNQDGIGTFSYDEFPPQEKRETFS